MQLNTSIADSIETAGNRSRYDAACKRLLANKRILAWIMKDCTEEYRDIPVEEIAEKYIEGTPLISAIPVMPDVVASDAENIAHAGTEDTSVNEGTIFYDIRFNAIAPSKKGLICLIVNVEAQYKSNPGYPLLKRGIYYGSRMISAQYGTVFTDTHYEKIQKVYSIWICMDVSKSRQNSITRYRIMEENLIGNVHEKLANYDLMAIVMIGLGKSDDNQYKGILRLLRTLLTSQANVADRKKILETEFQIPMSKEIEGEVSFMCNLSQGIVEEGKAKGRAEGEAKGRAEGEAKGKLDDIRSLMKTTGWGIIQAMDALLIPEADRAAYLEKLKS